MASISPEEIRRYIHDDPSVNYLLTGEEFDDARILQAKTMTIDQFNVMTPISNYDENSFPSRVIMLMGILYHLYNGEAAKTARNQMSYSDAGLQIPIEERFELYSRLAAQYGDQFLNTAKQYKIQLNIESGWGSVPSDYHNFPSW